MCWRSAVSGRLPSGTVDEGLDDRVWQLRVSAAQPPSLAELSAGILLILYIVTLDSPIFRVIVSLDNFTYCEVVFGECISSRVSI